MDFSIKVSAPYTVLEKPLDDYAMLCRGCLAESGEMKNILEWGYAEDFFKFTDIQLNKSGDSSVLLCTACECSLLHCKSFRTQCQASDLQLKNAAQNKSVKLTTDSIEESGTAPQENTICCVLNEKKLVIKITAPNTDSKIYLRCPYCQKSFVKQRDLLYHLVKTHSIDEKDFNINVQYYCSINTCSYYINSGYSKYFQGRKYLNQHYIKVHKRKILQCKDCSLSFATDTEFNRHLNTCNVIYLCQVCDIKYKSNEKLLVHLLRKHPDLHKQYKEERKALKRKSNTVTETKKIRTETEKIEYMCDSPKRSFATQTLKPEENIKNDVTLPSWQSIPGKSDAYETKTDEISTQTVFEDLLSLKSQTSEDESIFFSETVSLSDIQTQTFPLEFGLSRSNKETITSGTQSPDFSIKETQTCLCLYDSPKVNHRLFESVSSSPSSINLTSTETQTAELRSNVKYDALLSFSSAETQTSFEEGMDKQSL